LEGYAGWRRRWPCKFSGTRDTHVGSRSHQVPQMCETAALVAYIPRVVTLLYAVKPRPVKNLKMDRPPGVGGAPASVAGHRDQRRVAQ